MCGSRTPGEELTVLACFPQSVGKHSEPCREGSPFRNSVVVSHPCNDTFGIVEMNNVLHTTFLEPAPIETNDMQTRLVRTRTRSTPCSGAANTPSTDTCVVRLTRARARGSQLPRHVAMPTGSRQRPATQARHGAGRRSTDEISARQMTTVEIDSSYIAYSKQFVQWSERQNNVFPPLRRNPHSHATSCRLPIKLSLHKADDSGPA